MSKSLIICNKSLQYLKTYDDLFFKTCKQL